MIRWGLALLLVAAGCGFRKGEQPDALYGSARLQLRQGKLGPALATAEKGFSRSQGQPGTEWRSRFLLLRSEILVASGKAEEALRLLETFTPSGPKFTEFAALKKMNQGYARLHLTEFRPARALFEEAFQLANETGSGTLISQVENRRGSCFTRLYDSARADSSFRNALENARREGDEYLEMAALGNLGTLRLLTYRYDEAVPFLEQVLPLALRGDYQRFVAITRHNLGLCHAQLGDHDKGIRLMSQSEAQFVSLEDFVGQELCLGDLTNAYLANRQFDLAASTGRRALELARRVKDKLHESEWLNSLTGIAIEAGRWPEAESYNRQSKTLVEKIEDQHRRLDQAIYAARIAAGLGRFEEAVESLRRIVGRAKELGALRALLEARARLGSLYIRTRQDDKAEAQFIELAATVDDARSRLSSDEWKITFQSSVVPFYEDYVDLLVEQRRGDRALEIAESCRARLLAEKLGLGQQSASLAKAARFSALAREADAVLLAYWLAPRRSFLWVVSGGGTRTVALPPEKEISSLIDAHSTAIFNLDDPRELNAAAGRKLYQLLVAPAAAWIRTGAKVVLVPDGALHRLNFETLLAGEPAKYWIEEITLTVAPSLAVLAASRTPVKGSPQRDLLLMGDPVPSAEEWAPLADAATEIENVRRCFPAARTTVLTGPAARPAAYPAAHPAEFRRIHFSAHAAANTENPLDSAVILSPEAGVYKLYARDVAAVPLRADLVTISACRSAGARAYSGEGLVGFAWAFLQAGAKNVIAGLWDVNDRSTARLISLLYRRLSQGMPPADALRAAKLELLADPLYRKPYYWAPFVAFTRGM